METYTVIVYTNGNREWYQNDELHRLDGPALEYASGTRHWVRRNKRHRTDGPAIEYADGRKEWWIDGKELTEEQFNKRTQKSTCEDKTIVIDGITYKLVKA